MVSFRRYRNISKTRSILDRYLLTYTILLAKIVQVKTKKYTDKTIQAPAERNDIVRN